MLNVAYQLYQNVKSCVELNGKKSDYFCCNRGVRQGDSFSPHFFAIFVNDLESHFMQLGNNLIILQIIMNAAIQWYWLTLLISFKQQ